MAIELTKKDTAWLEKKLKQKSDNIWSGEISFSREFKGTSIEASYFLEVNFEPKQGSILPQVKEVGGKIKEISEELNLPIIDLHINKDDTICFGIYQKEKIYFPNGFSIQIFFEKILESYLYWVTYYRNHKTPPWEGYAHGELGHFELYAENNIELDELKEYIPTQKLLAYKKCKGHHFCICGSNKKLRNCHKLLYNAVYKLKKELHE